MVRSPSDKVLILFQVSPLTALKFAELTLKAGFPPGKDLREVCLELFTIDFFNSDTLSHLGHWLRYFRI